MKNNHFLPNLFKLMTKEMFKYTYTWQTMEFEFICSQERCWGRCDAKSEV